MELLVVTLANMIPGRDADVLTRIRLISDTIRNAPGLISSRFYRGRGNDSYYCMLTSWDDEESWQRAQERHNPRLLLLSSATELLTTSPQQWLMLYLWGYSRPAATPALAAAHLANIRPHQIELAQQGCIQGLQQEDLHTTLAFAFLARGARDEGTTANPPLHSAAPEPLNPSYQQGSTLLTLFSWANEEDREEFYADPHYRTIDNFINNLGTQHILPL
jgi:quinol monooxygenase YgiN